DQAEAHDHLRGRHRHHGEREDLTVTLGVVPRERDQGQVRPVEHDLEREQHDQRAAPDQDAERAGAEEEGGDAEVPDDVWARHWPAPSTGCSREGEPRITPPTAAISSTIEVISNASSWSVRNRRPISLGLPNDVAGSALCASRPLVFRPITTTI